VVGRRRRRKVCDTRALDAPDAEGLARERVVAEGSVCVCVCVRRKESTC